MSDQKERESVSAQVPPDDARHMDAEAREMIPRQAFGEQQQERPVTAEDVRRIVDELRARMEDYPSGADGGPGLTGY